MDYFKIINEKIAQYFNILEPDFPIWLKKYINTPKMLNLHFISTTCGALYTDLFDSHFFYSTLDHSIAVALIIWHFTHDKKQTLAGLFHDIATPVFKHCVDFLNGDYIKQESTEDLTYDFIADSKEITSLLKEDNINISEISNYHIYPIADNDTPQLSADRLEYSLSNALFTYNKASMKDIKEIYFDIDVQKNEQNIPELAFKTKSIARKFVKITSELSILYRADKTRYSMQFLADIMKKLNEDGLISIQDLYSKKESEIISLIKYSKYGNIYKKWEKAKRIKTSASEPKNVYYVHHGAKIRYIDPLVGKQRVSNICKIANKMIQKNLSYDMSKYVYLDFDF